MLKTMRKNTKVVIWGVILCFALWGGFSVSTQFQKEGRIAGEVFGKEITFQDYNSFYRAAQIFSLNTEPGEIPSEAKLRGQTWQNILYSREASRKGIEVSDDEVRAEVLRLLAAEGLTNPTQDTYSRWTQNVLRETPRQFETQVREVLRIQKLIKQVLAEPLPAAPVDPNAPKPAVEATEDDKKRDQFLKWNLELYQRAKLKSYLPALPEEQAAEPAPPAPQP